MHGFDRLLHDNCFEVATFPRAGSRTYCSTAPSWKRVVELISMGAACKALGCEGAEVETLHAWYVGGRIPRNGRHPCADAYMRTTYTALYDVLSECPSARLGACYFLGGQVDWKWVSFGASEKPNYSIETLRKVAKGCASTLVQLPTYQVTSMPQLQKVLDKAHAFETKRKAKEVLHVESAPIQGDAHAVAVIAPVKRKSKEPVHAVPKKRATASSGTVEEGSGETEDQYVGFMQQPHGGEHNPLLVDSVEGVAACRIQLALYYVISMAAPASGLNVRTNAMPGTPSRTVIDEVACAVSEFNIMQREGGGFVEAEIQGFMPLFNACLHMLYHVQLTFGFYSSYLVGGIGHGLVFTTFMSMMKTDKFSVMLALNAVQRHKKSLVSVVKQEETTAEVSDPHAFNVVLREEVVAGQTICLYSPMVCEHVEKSIRVTSLLQLFETAPHPAAEKYMFDGRAMAVSSICTALSMTSQTLCGLRMMGGMFTTQKLVEIFSGSLVNHSQEPNSRLVYCETLGMYKIVADLDIPKGKEVTVNYGFERTNQFTLFTMQEVLGVSAALFGIDNIEEFMQSGVRGNLVERITIMNIDAPPRQMAILGNSFPVFLKENSTPDEFESMKGNHLFLFRLHDLANEIDSHPWRFARCPMVSLPLGETISTDAAIVPGLSDVVITFTRCRHQDGKSAFHMV